MALLCHSRVFHAAESKASKALLTSLPVKLFGGVVSSVVT